MFTGAADVVAQGLVAIGALAFLIMPCLMAGRVDLDAEDPK